VCASQNDVELPKKKGLSAVDILMIAIIVLLLAKALGLLKAFFGIDPFGVLSSCRQLG
jgi:hypothetical protein